MKSILGNKIRKPDITFYRNGRIDISAHVVKALSMKRGDVIDILDHGMELYIFIRLHAPTVGNYKATCYETKKNSRNFRTYSIQLCDGIMKICGADDLPRIKLSVGEPVEIEGYGTALPLIYKNILNDDTGN